MEIICLYCKKKAMMREGAIFCSDLCRARHYRDKLKKENPEKYKQYNRELSRKMRKKHKERNLKRAIDRHNYDIQGEQCYFCKEKHNLQRHHFNYERNEVPLILCKLCHTKIEHLIKLKDYN